MLYTKGDLAQCGFIQCKYYYKNIIRTQSFTSLNADIYEDINKCLHLSDAIP